MPPDLFGYEQNKGYNQHCFTIVHTNSNVSISLTHFII